VSRDPTMFVIVVGCGRLGSHLANRLSRDGHSVVVIDQRESAFELLSAEYSGFRVEGDGTEFSVLQQAKAAQADLFVAATDSDNVNLMVGQVAKQLLGVRRVIARVLDPDRSEAYRGLGIETVCPTSLAAEALVQSIAPLTNGSGSGGSGA